LDPEDTHGAILAIGYALLGEHEQAQRELAAMRPLLDANEFLVLRLHTEMLAGRDAAVRELIEQALTTDPPQTQVLIRADELGLTSAPDMARRVLDRLKAIDPDWIKKSKIKQREPVFCTLAWSGDRDDAVAVFAPWEKRFSRRLPYTFATDDRRTGLARGLACTGRTEDAIVELLALVAKGYHAGGWRNLEVDHAFDALRDDARFQTLNKELRSVADEERQRYLARPDLVDADIESLASGASS
jgi:hypothetical protein